MGQLFLVVGNSGSGKDTLIREVQKQFPKDMKPIMVPKRVITRSPSPDTENFESVDEVTFLRLKNEEAFALDWHIYDLYYGVRTEIVRWLQQDYPVVVNVSRNIIEYARERFPGVKVIFIRVPFAIIEKRIQARKRESVDSLNARLDRARKNQELPSADFMVDNSGDLDKACKMMLDYIVSTVNDQ